MNTKIAFEISKWIYDGPYLLYSFQNTEETINELMNYEYYFANRNPGNELFGFFCFGEAALVPTYEKEAYNEIALDIGLGMKPEFCGRGLGFGFLCAGLEFAKMNKLEGRSKIRLTVADFNKRAIRLYEKAGFKYVRSLKHDETGIKFNVMILDLED